MNILLADDSKSFAALAIARLESLGHDVEWTSDGAAALASFIAAPPDLVLMDVEMPVMGGFEACSRIRAAESAGKWAWTPIIFLTATGTVENLLAAIKAGGDDFIPKDAPESVLAAKMSAMERIAALRRQLARANELLERQANVDSLTGLPNRRSLDHRADALWDGACRTAAPFTLVMLDLDRFKALNDASGHEAGDRSLRLAADALEAAAARLLPTGGFAARYGGEEFVVMAPGVGPDQAKLLADHLVASVRAAAIPRTPAAPGEPAVVTVSAGAASTDAAFGKLGALFRRADKLLYAAKAAGRDRALCDCVSDPSESRSPRHSVSGLSEDSGSGASS